MTDMCLIGEISLNLEAAGCDKMVANSLKLSYFYTHFIRDNLDYVTRVMIIIFFKYYSAMLSLNEQKRNELVSRSQSDILAPNETSRSKEISTLKRKSIFERKCLFNP